MDYKEFYNRKMRIAASAACALNSRRMTQLLRVTVLLDRAYPKLAAHYYREPYYIPSYWADQSDLYTEGAITCDPLSQSP